MTTSNKPRILTVEEILARTELPTEEVDVPEWGGIVKVRGFTKQEQIDIRNAATVADEIDMGKVELLMLVKGVVEPSFTDAQVGQLAALAAGVVDRILLVITRLSGMDAEAMRQAQRRFRPGK